MKPVMSSNTQAILLLTAPLIAGRGATSQDLLTPGEYKRLARHLRENHLEPADLISPDAVELIRGCGTVVDQGRLQRLLGRGFLLSQVVERWQSRAIWVVSRADVEYPRRLKARLREDSPAIIYGCGDAALLELGGLAVIGSRHVDDALINHTMAVGRLTGGARKVLVSGGAKGIDQAAMRGALEAGGRVVGVLADSLEQTSLNREHRNLLRDGQLVLISPYDPSAGFNVGNAMQRNKLIYALADAALVISSDLKKGGTWTGAVEQLDKLKSVPLYVRSLGDSSPGLDALRKKGAMPWPNPRDAQGLESLLQDAASVVVVTSQSQQTLFASDESAVPADRSGTSTDHVHARSQYCDQSPAESIAAAEVDAPTNRRDAGDLEQAGPTTGEEADVLFAAVRASMRRLLSSPKKDAEVAEALRISKTQAKAWLERLVEEGVIKKQRKPSGYVVVQEQLFKGNGVAAGSRRAIGS
jgi:predicted Rossmann fold nucleotide-binding protein DprA/Smf involved in DNA uptake